MPEYRELDWQDNLPFGMYVGHMVGEVCEDDPAYLHWMMNNTSLRFKEHVAKQIEEDAAEVDYKPSPNRPGY